MTRRVYRVSDESGHVERIRSTSSLRAAQRYVATGDWSGDEPGTQVHEITVTTSDDYVTMEIVTREVPPDRCKSYQSGRHRWRDTYARGGENGGVRVDEACRCGLHRVTETRGQSRVSGRTVPGGVVRYQLE